MMRPYLDKQAAENFKNYKYVGGDNGRMYTYFWSPVAGYIVERTPEWVSPNMMTFSGFLCVMIPQFIIFSCVGAAMVGDVPNWFVVLQFTLYFCYRMFDEMDGKQARRTANGTPFGMIFDHGIDCMALGSSLLMFMRIMQVGDNFIVKGMLIVAYQAFYCVTLEHYYFGALFMPWINGVSDGAIAIVCLGIYSVYHGVNVWATPYCDGRWLNLNGVEDLALGQFTIMTIGVAMFGTGILSMVSIFLSRYYPHKTQNERPEFDTLFIQLSWFWMWCTLWLLFGEMGHDPIAIRNPIVVTNESSRLAQDSVDYGQGYQTIHYFLFTLVVVY